MNWLLKIIVTVSLFCIVKSSQAPTIHVSSIEGNILFGYLESSSLCRLSFTQRSSDDLTVSNAEKETKYLFTIRQNGNFSLHFDMSTITTKGVLVLYVNCDNGSSRSILNYKLDKKYYMCNANAITIGDIAQTKDSCAYVTFQYNGVGDLYVLNRVSKSNIPTARNIINEGIYLGKHNAESVSTVICRIFENTVYTLYATVIDGDCIHSPVSKEYTTEAFSPGMKWSASSNPIWVTSYSGNINHGVHYRRFGGLVYPGSFLNELNVTPEGILLNTMDEVYAKMRENQDAGMSDDSLNGIVNNNLVWRTVTFEKNRIDGLLLVFGKGNIFIYCSTQKGNLEIQDVVLHGKNVGYFEDDAVDIHIDGLTENSYTVYAVFAYNDQYFGPYPKTVQKK